MNKKEFKNKISSGLETLNIYYSTEQLEQLWVYYNFLKTENKKYNLTSIVEAEAVIKKHFLDSLALLPHINNEETHRWLDIGTGAGFPGLILKLFLPGDGFYLIDSSSKKINFLNQLIYKLKISGVEATHGRAEDLADIEGWRESFDFVTSRAVAPLNILLEYVLPFVRNAGFAYLYKGPDYKKEIDKADNALEVLGGRIEKTLKVDVPGLSAERYILMIRKTGYTDEKYPRRAGIPEKRPL
ncbi:MAG: 16S rRNA (guanine(527)-N(7))-methyltransferase RsmG [Bacillota bacterium]